MPNIVINSITRNGSVSISVPRFTIDAAITSSKQGDNTVYRDWTGANALSFPAFLNSFSASELMEIMQAIMAKAEEITLRSIVE